MHVLVSVAGGSWVGSCLDVVSGRGYPARLPCRPSSLMTSSVLIPSFDLGPSSQSLRRTDAVG